MVQAARPQNSSAVLTMCDVLWYLCQNQPRVVGGMMSRRADSRSASVSDEGSKLESVEISESARKGNRDAD
jgi:hypothetical protein